MRVYVPGYGTFVYLVRFHSDSSL